MKRLLVFLGLVAGCADSHLLINRAYTQDGYTVKGIHGTYAWSEKKKRATLTTGEGFEQRVYTDKDADGRPDEILYQYETVLRSTDGTAAMFETADRDWELAKTRYDLPAIHAEWEAMPPDERARREDFFK